MYSLTIMQIVSYVYCIVRKINRTSMLKGRYKNKILSIINQYIPGCTVYLFGSRARDDAHTSSDIDLAFDAGKKIEFRILCKIKEELEDTIIPFFIDVIDVHDVDDKFLQEIKKSFIKLEN